MATLHDLKTTPGVAPTRDPATAGFTLQQTMMRISDPEKSLAFYTGVLGFRLEAKLDFPDKEFTLFFLSLDLAPLPTDEADRLQHVFSRPAYLELCWNYDGSGATPDQQHGWGHIGISVPSLAAAVKHVDKRGVKFVKRPEDGTMREIAFVADPDGYLIEIIEPALMRSYARDLPPAVVA